MKLYQTKRLEETAKLPTNYDFQKILQVRRKVCNKVEAYKFHRTKAGVEGEDKVLEYLERYGKDHWIVLQNLWLDYYGTYESDIILLTSTNCYVFEVKNYEGIFTYHNGICKLNDRQLDNNCIAQTNRAHSNLNKLCSEAGLYCKPKGALVFIGEDNWVDIQSETPGIKVLMRNQLKNFIQKIIQEENNYKKIDHEKILNVFEKYEIANPFSPKPLEKKELIELRKGIYCAWCENFELKINNKYVSCSCGFHEPREEAIIRTICEYGVLHYNKKLTTKKLLDFLDSKISRTNLVSLLRANFEVVYKNKYTYYRNKKLPYYKIADEFDIPLDKKMYSTDKKLVNFYKNLENIPHS